MKYVKLTDLSGSDQDLRDRIQTYANGHYVIQICKGCGVYLSDPDGNTDTAVIVDQCRMCFEPQCVNDEVEGNQK